MTEPITEKIAEILRKKIEVAHLVDVMVKHDERRATKSDQPIFPVEDRER